MCHVVRDTSKPQREGLGVDGVWVGARVAEEGRSVPALENHLLAAPCTSVSGRPDLPAYIQTGFKVSKDNSNHKQGEKRWERRQRVQSPAQDTRESTIW